MMKHGRDIQTAFENAISNFIVALEDFCGPDFLCIRCRNAMGNTKEGGCRAFPGRALPRDILVDHFQHTKMHPEQDNDILFDPIEND